MLAYDVWELLMLVHHSNDLRKFVAKMCDVGARDERIPEEVINKSLNPILIMAQIQAKKVQLQSTWERVWEGGGPFWMAAKVGLTWQQLGSELEVLIQAIEADAQKRLFVFVRPEKAELIGTIDSIWEPVSKAMAEAQNDIQEAIYCYVLERDTGAVFHLMRVAEHGLRRLAKKLNVRLTHSGHYQPIEFADWNKIITAIRNKITKATVLPLGPRRQQQMEIYSDVADHCLFMKDIWRNNISHTRQLYKSGEALGVLERVRDFMQFLVRNFV